MKPLQTLGWTCAFPRSGLRSSWLTCSFAVFAYSLANAGVPDLTPVSAAEVKSVKEHIRAALMNRSDLPTDPISSFKLERNVYWSAPQGGHLLLPITVKFHGITNSYCRVATLARVESEPILIDVPQQANYDQCRGFRNMRFLDVNGDELLDIAASVSIKSNSFEGYVDEQVVYLSAANKPGGYCFSDSASRNLRPEHMLSSKKVKEALDRERKRLGISQFACTPVTLP